jgi:hypothetical protein
MLIPGPSPCWPVLVQPAMVLPESPGVATLTAAGTMAIHDRVLVRPKLSAPQGTLALGGSYVGKRQGTQGLGSVGAGATSRRGWEAGPADGVDSRAGNSHGSRMMRAGAGGDLTGR